MGANIMKKKKWRSPNPGQALGPFSEGEIYCYSGFINLLYFHSEGKWYDMNDKSQFPKRKNYE